MIAQLWRARTPLFPLWLASRSLASTAQFTNWSCSSSISSGSSPVFQTIHYPLTGSCAYVLSLSGLNVSSSRFWKSKVLGSSMISTAAKASNTDMNERSEADSGIVMIYVTVPCRDSGKKIAHALVSEKLAACVNIVPGLESVYEWEGKVNEDPEELLLIKTKQSLVPIVTKRVQKLHPYTECEVVAVPIIGGSSSYIGWVKDITIMP